MRNQIELKIELKCSIELKCGIKFKCSIYRAIKWDSQLSKAIFDCLIVYRTIKCDSQLPKTFLDCLILSSTRLQATLSIFGTNGVLYWGSRLRESCTLTIPGFVPPLSAGGTLGQNLHEGNEQGPRFQETQMRSKVSWRGNLLIGPPVAAADPAGLPKRACLPVCLQMGRHTGRQAHGQADGWAARSIGMPLDQLAYRPVCQLRHGWEGRLPRKPADMPV